MKESDFVSPTVREVETCDLVPSAKDVEDSSSGSDQQNAFLMAVFDPKYDGHFQNIIDLTESIFRSVGVKISFPAGDKLRMRATNSGELTIMPLKSTLCGLAVRQGLPLEFSNRTKE